MNSFSISLAGVAIEVQSIYDEVYEMCLPYLSDRKGVFSVRIDPADISFEREKSIREAIMEGRPIEKFTDSYLETLAVYRKIAVKMPDYGTFLMHGSAVSVGDKAFMFTASSGTGKTTHTRLWLSNIPGTSVVNGDKPLLRIQNARAEVCGTPWAGKEALNTNVIVPLKTICLLERGQENRIEETSFRDIYPTLLQQTYRPSNSVPMLKTMQLLKQLSDNIRFYRMKCNMNPDAAFVAYECMNHK